MDKEKLIQRLMASFLEELGDHVRALNRDLLALEKNPEGEGRGDLLQTLFRTAHTMKSAARAVSVRRVEAAAHQLEDVLGAARDGQLPLGPKLFELLFEVADAMEDARNRLSQKQTLTDAPLSKLMSRLQAAAQGKLAETPAAEHREPAQAVETPLPDTSSELPEPSTPPPEVSPADAASQVAEAGAAEVAAAEVDEPAPTSPGGSVRVAAERLDALVARSGELLIALRRLEGWDEALQDLQELARRCTSRWRSLAGPFVELSEDQGFQERDGPALKSDARPLGARALEPLSEDLTRLRNDVERLVAGLAADRRALAGAAGPLDEEVRGTRMVPFREACQGLQRTVRDFEKAEGKRAHLALEGTEVEMDRGILEALKDPLLHLVRNAVGHGVEPPEERKAAGKPDRGRISVSAALRGSQVEVVVEDDGRGFDMDAIRAAARQKELPEPEDDKELARLAFLPGISTARMITDLAGRGVGLDVVKTRVEELHGTIDVVSGSGRGARFTLVVPLTLTMARVLLVTAGGQVFALTDTNVRYVLRVGPEHLRTVEGREVLSLDEGPVPVASLARTLGLAEREPATTRRRMPLVVVETGGQRTAFTVEEFLDEQEVMVKSLGSRLKRVRNVAGATILPTGRIALILNAADLIRTAQDRPSAQTLSGALTETPAEEKKHLLLVEDSLTTRSLEKMILEGAGFRVSTAVDGERAWRMLQESGADLVVSDVEMPAMDGFGLTRNIRGSERFRDLPVILVTGRDRKEDKARGLEVGADAYLVKSAFDQTGLLETIRQLL